MHSRTISAFGEMPSARSRPRGDAPRRSRSRARRAPPQQQQQQRQHGEHAEDADRDMRRAPAVRRDEVLHDRRPDRAGEIIAAGGDRDRDAAPALEPVRHVRHQRAETRRGAEPDQHMREREQHEIGRQPDSDVADAERRASPNERHDDAEAVGQPAHRHAAERRSPAWSACKAATRRRARRRTPPARRAARPHRPHADAADGADQNRDRQAPPGGGQIDLGRRFVRRGPDAIGWGNSRRADLLAGRPVKLARFMTGICGGERRYPSLHEELRAAVPSRPVPARK